MTVPHLLIDASVSLINRTGAHYIAQDIVAAFGREASVRYWRLLRHAPPPGLRGKLCGRAMLRELLALGQARLLPWPEPARTPLKRLFLDPLYVLRSRLETDDVVLCHDIGPVTHPQLYDAGTVRLYAAAYARLAARGAGIVFVSEASRQAFVARFGSGFRFLRVIPLYTRSGSAGAAARPLPGVRAPFLLTVGAFDGRKNQLAAIEAYRRSGLQARGIGYVLVGAGGAAMGDVAAAARQVPGVTIASFIDDAQLRWLYREATAFVLPSLLEGFGMPALEAAAHGLVPVISRDSALSEAVGGLGLAVDPHSVDDIARGLREAVELPAPRRAQLAQALAGHAAAATRECFVERWHGLLSDELGERLPAPATAVAA